MGFKSLEIYTCWKSEKPIEEDDRSTRVQERINENVENLQPKDELLEESDMIVEESCIVVQVCD